MTFDQIKQSLIQRAADYQTLVGGTGISLSDRVRNFGQKAQTTGYNMAAGLANNVAPNVGATVSKYQTTPGSLSDKLIASGKQLINPRPLDTMQTFTVGGTQADTGKVLQERVSLAQRLKSEGKDPSLAQQGLMPTQIKSIKNAAIALGTGGDMKKTMGMSTKAVNQSDDLLSEAKKYKSPDEFVKAQEGGVRGLDTGKYGKANLAPAELGSWSVADIASGKSPLQSSVSIDKLKLSNQSPDIFIDFKKSGAVGNVKDGFTVYRVVPDGNGINAGDFVFSNKASAQKFLDDYGYKRGQNKIKELTGIKLDELLLPKTEQEFYRTRSASMKYPVDELIYAPREIQNVNLTDIWNKAHNK